MLLETCEGRKRTQRSKALAGCCRSRWCTGSGIVGAQTRRLCKSRQPRVQSRETYLHVPIGTCSLKKLQAVRQLCRMSPLTSRSGGAKGS